MTRNKEGYPDPTAAAAMGTVMKDYKRKQKEKWKQQYESKHRDKVYVISKYAGNVSKNKKATISYCKYVISQNKQPVASHLLYPQMLSDDDPKSRELGLAFGLNLLADCQEAWCFGKEISSGMAAELKECEKLRIPVRYFKEEKYADNRARRH